MAGLLQFEGSVLPESVRRAAQAALDNRSDMMNEGRRNAGPKPAGWTDGQRNIDLKGAGQGLKGLLSGAGKVAGGLGAAYDLAQGANQKWGMGAWDNAQDIANKREVRLAAEADPELPVIGVRAAQGMADRAVESARGLMDVMPRKDTTRMEGLSMLPMAPEAKQEAAAVTEQAPQVEAGRQRIEAGTLKGLQTGQVHVSQLAQGVVQADAQRAGTQLKPDEEKAAVTAEIAAMKTMDKSDLARYVSYAMVAGGLLAAVFDKTGEAGAAFHDSLNKQLDRNLAAGKMAFDQKMAQNKDARENRKVDINETDVNSKVEDRKVNQEQGAQRIAQGDQKIGIMEADSRTKAFAANSSASNARAKLGLLGEQLEIQRGEAASKQAYRQSKIDNPSGGQDKGVPLSYKDNGALVKDVFKSQGLKVDPALQSQIAGRLPTLQKKYPQLSQAELVELAAGEYDTETDVGWINDTVRIKKPKGE